MQQVVIVIHLMIVLALVVVVLLQKSEGGALGIGGGGGFMAGRSSSNPLSRLTAYLAAGFFATSMALTIMAGYGGGSVMDRLQPSAAAPRQPAGDAGGPQAPLGSGQGGILPEINKIRSQTQGAQPAGAPQPPMGAGAQAQPEPKFDAMPTPQGDVNTPPQDADRQQPGGAQTAPMPQDAQPVAPQVSDPSQAGGDQGVKQAPSQQTAPEGSGATPQSSAPNAGPPAPSGGQ